jgi:hypothetical protein
MSCFDGLTIWHILALAFGIWAIAFEFYPLGKNDDSSDCGLD